MITSGALFGTVYFYQQSVTADFAGGTSGVYTLLLKTRANVTPLTGHRALEDGQRTDIKAVQFTIRWRRDITLTTSLLLVYNNLPYAVYSIVDTDNKRQEFVLLARAKEGLTNIPLSTGGTMEFKSQFKTQFG